MASDEMSHTQLSQSKWPLIHIGKLSDDTRGVGFYLKPKARLPCHRKQAIYLRIYDISAGRYGCLNAKKCLKGP